MNLTQTKPEVLDYVEAQWANALYINYPQRAAVIHDARLARHLEAAINKLDPVLREAVTLDVITSMDREGRA